MDHVAFPLVVGGAATVVATAFSLLPERLDVTHVFAAYGAGAICGEAVAARNPGVDQSATMRRWGALFMAAIGGIWILGLVLAIL